MIDGSFVVLLVSVILSIFNASLAVVILWSHIDIDKKLRGLTVKIKNRRRI